MREDREQRWRRQASPGPGTWSFVLFKERGLGGAPSLGARPAGWELPLHSWAGLAVPLEAPSKCVSKEKQPPTWGGGREEVSGGKGQGGRCQRTRKTPLSVQCICNKTRNSYGHGVAHISLHQGCRSEGPEQTAHHHISLFLWLPGERRRVSPVHQVCRSKVAVVWLTWWGHAKPLAPNTGLRAAFCSSVHTYRQPVGHDGGPAGHTLPHNSPGFPLPREFSLKKNKQNQNVPL